MQDRFVLEGEREDGMHLTVCMAAPGATLFDPSPFDHRTHLPRAPSFVLQAYGQHYEML
jgi:hypothetical protein